MAQRVLIDVDDSDSDNPNQSWDEAYWIRPKDPRPYPASDVPPAVAEQKRYLLRLPPATDELLPPVIISVSAFLSDWPYCPVPRQSKIPQKVLFSSSDYDSNPHAIVKALRQRLTFPPLPVVLGLEKALGQAWFNGMCSVEDTFYVGYKVPFWCLTLWRELAYVFAARENWRVVEERITSCKHRDHEIHLQIRQVADRLLGLLQQLAWRVPICGFSTAGWRPGADAPALPTSCGEESATPLTTSFIQFFKDDYLDDEALNMMLHFIRLQVQRHPSFATSVAIGDIAFSQRLITDYAGKNSFHSSHVLLARYEDLFKTLGRTLLYFVVNSGQNHWVTVQVDFEHRTFAYGDSLATIRAQDKTIISAVTSWLRCAFPSFGSFTQAENLACERQRDGWSCGITACALIASLLGFDSAWTSDKAQLWRLTWAQRIMQIHVQSAGPVYNSTYSSKNPTSENSKVLATTETAAPSNRMAIDSLLNNEEDECAGSDSDSSVVVLSDKKAPETTGVDSQTLDGYDLGPVPAHASVKSDASLFMEGDSSETGSQWDDRDEDASIHAKINNHIVSSICRNN
ncbi:hypothetical protein BDV93DRAFT_515810 [Ceratobasidium sp. AG-I]|nr:hypothetical protein BDV93DRAFT_515810 [Ceratobasidium sp. AG-I]